MRHRLVPLLLLSLAFGTPVHGDLPVTDLADHSFQAAQWIMFTATSRAVAGVGARLAAGEACCCVTGRPPRTRCNAPATT